MMIFYLVYCVALHFNTALEKWAQPYILKLPIKLPTREEQSSLVTFKNAPESSYTQGMDAVSPQQELNEAADTSIYDPNSSWDPNAAWTDDSVSKPAPAANAFKSNVNYNANDGWGDSNTGTSNFGYAQSEMDDSGVISEKPAAVSTTVAVQNNNDQDYYKPKEQRPELPDPLIKPENADLLTIVNWHIVYPIHYLCRLTMVDVKQEKYKKWYPVTFCISMVWISFYSYFMVWMITIIGFTLGIPDTVMGNLTGII